MLLHEKNCYSIPNKCDTRILTPMRIRMTPPKSSGFSLRDMALPKREPRLVPRILNIKDTSEAELGYLIYFFEKACAISGYTLGINPFNQPGVESYKKNMFALLGKPGYEDQKEALEARLK